MNQLRPLDKSPSRTQRVTSGSYLMVLLFISLPSIALSAPTLRDRSIVAGSNSDLQLKNCSLQLNRIRTATRRYLSAIGDSNAGMLSVLNDVSRNSSSARSPADENNSAPALITDPPAVTNLLNKTSLTIGGVKVNTPHLKYLNSPSDSKWVAQCLNGGKCIKDNSTKEIRQKRPDSKQPTLEIPVVDIEVNSSGIPPDISASSDSDLSMRLNKYSSFVPEEINQDKHKSKEVEIESATLAVMSTNQTGAEKVDDGFDGIRSPQNNRFSEKSNPNSGVPLNMTVEKEMHNTPSNLKSRPELKENRLVVPISLEEDGLSYNSEEPSTIRAEGLPSILAGVKSDIGMGLQKVANEYDNLPVSIRLTPVIHNHYYNRRQIKSAGINPKNVSDAIDPNHQKTEVTHPDVISNSIPQKEASTEISEGMGLPKDKRQCEDVSMPGCGKWGSVENLAAGDLVTRISTEKRQSYGNYYGSGDNDSVIKTEILNKDYPEVPPIKNGTSNIFFIMGGLWTVNIYDHTTETLKTKSISPDTDSNIVSENNVVRPLTNNVIAPTNLSRFYKKPVTGYENSNIQPNSYLSNQQPFVGASNVPRYSTRNFVPKMSSYERASAKDGMEYINGPYGGMYQSTGGLNTPIWGNGYYQSNQDPGTNLNQPTNNQQPNQPTTQPAINLNPGNNLPSSESARLNYPESLVNLPLEKVYEHQGDDMGYLHTPVKPEEYAAHDMSTGDMVVLGGQLLASFQTPEVNKPDPEYPLQPIETGNDYDPELNEYSRASSIGNYANRAGSAQFSPYHIPSMYNSSWSTPSREVLVPQQIFINSRSLMAPQSVSGLHYQPTLRNPWTGNAIGNDDFVDGQYVKRYRGAKAYFKKKIHNGYMNEKHPLGLHCQR